MAASHDRIEWHLTPRGWETGTFYRDGVVEEKEPPPDRVLTMAFDAVWSSIFSKGPRTRTEEVWRAKDDKAIDRCLKQFGPCPDRF